MASAVRALVSKKKKRYCPPIDGIPFCALYFFTVSIGARTSPSSKAFLRFYYYQAVIGQYASTRTCYQCLALPCPLFFPFSPPFFKMPIVLCSYNYRFQEDGFDLDLTYITDRIIAMGFPSQGTEAYFRNPLSEVQRFFNTRHAEHYKV